MGDFGDSREALPFFGERKSAGKRFDNARFLASSRLESGRIRTIKGAMFIFALLALALVVTGCKTGGKAAPVSSGSTLAVPVESAADAVSAGSEFTAVSLDDVLAEARDFQIPAQADAAVFESLKAEFIRLVEEIAKNSADGRTVSAAPNYDGMVFEDFSFDYETRRISWTYKNTGDYDISGEVYISDITPIAIHYGKKVFYGDDGRPLGDINTPEGKNNHYLAWIDGDGNGEIGIGDITPIAIYYATVVTGYFIKTSFADELKRYRTLKEVPFGETGVFPKKFDIVLPYGYGKYVAVVLDVPWVQLKDKIYEKFEMPVFPESPHPAPMIGLNPQRNGRSLFAGPQDGKVLWKRSIPDIDSSSAIMPIVDKENTVYVTLRDGRLLALNPDGTDKWICETGAEWLSLPSIADDGTIYLADDRGRTIYAINQDGTLKWQTDTGYMLRSSVTPLFNGKLYVGGDDQTFSFSLDSLDSNWHSNNYLGYFPFIEPTFSLSGNAYFTRSNEVYANLNYFSYLYSDRWSFVPNWWIEFPVALADDGTLYVESGGLHESALTALSSAGDELWTYSRENSWAPMPVVANDGSVYTMDGPKKLVSISPTGEVQWTFEEGIVKGGIMAADSSGVIFFSGYGKVYAVNPDGTLKWSQPVNSYTGGCAIGTDGILYYFSDYELIYAFADELELPVIHSVSPQVVNAGELVSFESIVSYPQKYKWNFGPNATASNDFSQNPSVVFREPGWHTCSLVAENNAGTDTYEFQVFASDVPGPPYLENINGGSHPRDFEYFYVNAGIKAQLNAFVSGTFPIEYLWNFGPGATPETSTNNSTFVTFAAPGEYPCSLTSTNQHGSDVYEFTITAWPPPNLLGVTPQTVTADEIVKFELESEGMASYIYWDFGIASTPNKPSGKSVTVQITDTPGLYPVSVRAYTYHSSKNFYFNFDLEVLAAG